MITQPNAQHDVAEPLHPDDPGLSRDIVSWCHRVAGEPLPPSAVPGATLRQRRALASLGGLAAALAEAATLDTNTWDRWPNAVASWAKCAPRPPLVLVERARTAIEARGQTDILAHLYERIVAGPNRRHLGTFFTPPPVLDYMISRTKQLLSAGPDIVIDPGAGVGAFTEGALHHWPDSQIHAVDVNIVTLGLLAARCAVLNSPNQPIFVHGDYLEWVTRIESDSLKSRLIIGNPPYTRHQLLDRKTKEAAHAASGPLCPNGQAGLSTHFLAATLRALGPRDSICFLLPANWLETRYAREVRKYLWELRNRTVQIHAFPHEAVIFPSAQVSAMIVIVGPETDRTQSMSYYSVTQGMDFNFQATCLANTQRKTLCPPSFTVQAFSGTSTKSEETGAPQTVLSSIAVVRRGVATGDNEFFLRRDSEVAGLPEGAYVPALPTLRKVPEQDLTPTAHQILGASGVRRWLLRLDNVPLDNEAVRALIGDGESRGTPGRYLCRVRNPWYAVERMPIPDILIAPMTKSRFRVVQNLAGATPTNSIYGIRLIRRTDAVESARELVAWLRSDVGQQALISIARRHGDGLFKLEPRALSNLNVPIQ
ncbi:N-6 DNA methylase [Streptomyces sp. NPDC047453]|uniref:Eco57I restriction-modification methylase domain-containing protein n=1 Tax=Streptomyces sp. NPDC047453 TaxID=3154812 RepID=UPI0033D2D36B